MKMYFWATFVFSFSRGVIGDKTFTVSCFVMSHPSFLIHTFFFRPWISYIFFHHFILK